MNKKAGRPKKAVIDSRVPGISVRLNPLERLAIDGAAKSCGLKLSDWARKALIYIVTNDIRIT